jgi:D-aspartate ligase
MKPGVLLLAGDFHGTLAALRSLGRAGVDVTVADWRTLVPARWSCWATRSYTCPDPSTDPSGLVRWLLELGQSSPGLVLLPTTDDLAWLYARHAEALKPHFIVDAPRLEAVYGLLNKWKLREACTAVGIETPESWLPGTEGVRFPLVIKPQTQTLLSPHQKGRVVRSPDQLEASFYEFRRATKHAPELLEVDPGASQPMLQELISSRGIYGLSGFIDPGGELFVVAAARKVLQRPQVLGIGLCFQQAPVVRSLADRLRALCRHLGYHGLFEVEFLERDGHHLMIDFNPRCYGQMGFDVARGADLPLIAYLRAIGDVAALREEVEVARHRLQHEPPQAWCDRINLELFVRLKSLVGSIDPATARAWTRWISVHQPHVTDAVIDPYDWMPGVVAAVSAVWNHAIHPRSTWRAIRET